MSEKKKEVIRLSMLGCNRDTAALTKEIREIGGVPFVMHDINTGEEHDMCFVVRGLTVAEWRAIRGLQGKVVLRQTVKLNATGQILTDGDGKIIYDNETYSESDPTAPKLVEALAILALGGDISPSIKASPAANEKTNCGWFIDGKKQAFSIDVWEGWCWEHAPALKAAIIEEALALTTVPDKLVKK